jgi:NAD(P)-dependent dehydrogenase (short-subunit alcohol dehydrogenase family)
MSRQSKNAIVTGGGQGLGRAIALELARTGSRVVLVQRTRATLDRTVAEIRDMGGWAQGLSVDLRQADQIAPMMEQARQAFGGSVGILVNNAGSPDSYETFEESGLETWQSVIDLSLRAAYLCSKEVAKEMIAAGWGRILNVAAIQAYMPLAGNAAYAAAKGGVISLTRSMAVDLTRHGIIVNAIAPGPFDVRWPEDVAANPDGPWPTLLGRRGRPEEVATLAAFLVSDDCTFVVGETILCDGGRMLAREGEPLPR